MTYLPKQVILSGIAYRVTVHEGIVIFEEEICMSGHHSRMVFERPKDCGWYIQFSDTHAKMNVEHIVAAYELLRQVYGGTFDVKKEV